MIHAHSAEIGLPSTPALKVDGTRVPASGRRTQSAWYDAFAIGEQRHAVLVGNVAGDQAQTAQLMLALRSGLQEAALGVAGPGALLRIARGVFRSPTFATDAVATAIIGIVDSVHQTFTYVSAGHSPPVIRYADGTVAALPAGGEAIGRAEFDQPSAEFVVDLGDAVLLVLSSQIRVGVPAIADEENRRLREVLADERVLYCDFPADWIAQRFVERHPHAEAALLSLRFATRGGRAAFAAPGALPRWSASWSFEATGPASTGARRAFVAALTSKSAAGQAIDIAAAELIFGELFGNVVRHAPGLVEITLDCTGESPVLHMRDNGPGFHSRRSRERLPEDDWSESGRGLFIVNACATEFTVRNRTGRGTHATATLPSAEPKPKSDISPAAS